VFRALVGYGIAAFAVLQIIEPIMHGLHWPHEVLTYVPTTPEIDRDWEEMDRARGSVSEAGMRCPFAGQRGGDCNHNCCSERQR
jgi:hypothetical protein